MVKVERYLDDYSLIMSWSCPVVRISQAQHTWPRTITSQHAASYFILLKNGPIFQLASLEQWMGLSYTEYRAKGVTV